jgi:hypothetical protein
MRLTLAFILLTIAPAVAQPTAFCGYGQPCQNGNSVPFPVINPVQGLSNILTLPLRNGQPSPPPPAWAYAPIATPPPVLPPGVTPPANAP